MKTLATKLAVGSSHQRPNKLNILIGDASGSMYWAMGQLSADTIQRVEALPQGDAVLIGLFSTEGWFRWIVQSELNKPQDYELVKAQIQKEFYTRGMTCFSEILSDVPRTIEPWLAKYPVATMTFMSDGHPVVANTQQEIANSLAAAEAIGRLVVAGSVVAYGDYANRQLLAQIAQKAGAELVTARNVQEVGEAFAKNAGIPAAKKRAVKIPKDALLVFSLDMLAGAVSTLDTSQESAQVAETADVFLLENMQNLQAPADVQDPDGVLYAAALALVGDSRVDAALEVLSNLGDVHAVTTLGNALTNSELAEVENILRECIKEPAKRFLAGRKVGCLPRPDAPDLLEVLGILMDDKEALFYPQSPAFEYKRIGRPSKTEAGYPRFLPADSVGVPLSNLVGHSRELNLSVLTRIPGTIQLPEEAGGVQRKATGFGEVYDTFVWRNYALVANGLPQVRILPCSVSEETYYKLLGMGVISVQEWTRGKIYQLDLSAVPVCNRVRGEDSCRWEEFGRLELESQKLGAKIKVFKARRQELDPEGEAQKPVDLTDEQIKFLTAVGIRLADGSYSPPTESEEPTDVMTVRLFEVKVGKLGTMSWKEFQTRVAENKPLNLVGSWMKEGWDALSQMPSTKGSALEWLDEQITKNLAQQRAVDKELNNRRFAVAVGGHWARHFQTDEHSLAVDGQDIKLVFRQVDKQI